MTRCNSIRADLDAYRDHSLAQSRHNEIEAHLQTCPSCRARHDEAAAIEQQIQDAAREWQPSADLWSRIQQSAAADSARASTVPRPRMSGAGWAAAFFLFAIGVIGYLQIDQQSATDPQGVATALVNEFHTFVVSRRDLDYNNNRPEQIRNWFSNKVDFRVPLPVKTESLSPSGGRLCNLLDQRIASFMYRVDGAWVSLYIMKDGSLRSARMPDEGQVLRGYGYIEWHDQGLHYSLIGDVSAAKLRQIADTLYRGDNMSQRRQTPTRLPQARLEAT